MLILCSIMMLAIMMILQENKLYGPDKLHIKNKNLHTINLNLMKKITEQRRIDLAATT